MLLKISGAGSQPMKSLVVPVVVFKILVWMNEWKRETFGASFFSQWRLLFYVVWESIDFTRHIAQLLASVT